MFSYTQYLPIIAVNKDYCVRNALQSGLKKILNENS